MISEYVTFNAARFVKDYYRYKRTVEDLQAKMREAEDIRGIATDGVKVRTSPSKAQVERVVLRRITIQERIDQYNEHIRTCEEALSSLPPDERHVLEVFFTSSSKTAAIMRLEDTGFSRSTAYKIRQRALEKISELVAGISPTEKDGE